MAAVRGGGGDSTPICRCRVLYLGSAVPQVTKDGLQGIQEPLRELYPEQGAIGARGIDSWLSVWSNGLLLENVDENHKKVTRFFPIDTLHYCAAVRYVLVPEKSSVSSSSSQPRFLPLDSPFARSPNPSHPPLFAAILRRTTGIKVLECHTFICKREMAANALVRCCFHAYADSAYARQIDSGGNTYSTYGTLSNCNKPAASSSIEKVEGWNRTTSGSMFTLNNTLQPIEQNNHRAATQDNSESENMADDISIYNGDENHKIWAGSTRDISTADKDYVYGEYGVNTMRSTRSTRPRQIINAPPPPPPPVKEEKRKINKDKSKKPRMGRKEDMYSTISGTYMRPSTSQGMVNGMRSHSSLSGTMPKCHPNHIYSNGTVLRPASSHVGYHPPPPPPPHMIMVPATLPHPRNMLHHPPKGGIMVPVHPHMMPPNFVPLPPHPMYLQPGMKPPKHYQITMEEPIYMPSTRPLSPVASYQPNHFPHEAYLMQQYATLDVHSKKKDKFNKRNLVESLNGDCADYVEGEHAFNADIPVKKDKESKKLKGRVQSINGDITIQHDDEEEAAFASQLYRKKHKDTKNGRKSSGENDGAAEDGESPFGTGIYRRKGHLNERAFSYSIRQEHRSRSYGSLANLKFAPPPIIANGSGRSQDTQYYNGSTNKEEIKKEREIVQMMQDLDLTGDELERCEVPDNVYRQHMKQSTKVRR